MKVLKDAVCISFAFVCLRQDIESLMGAGCLNKNEFLSVLAISLKYSSEETQKTSCSSLLHLSNFNFSPILQVSLPSTRELQGMPETARSSKPQLNYALLCYDNSLCIAHSTRLVTLYHSSW